MRIQLLCDHKWRDLPNLTAIKLKLEQLGHAVLVSTTKDAVPLANLFRPDCVVFNHLFGETYRKLSRALNEAGVAVVLLPTEGAMRPEYESIAAGEFADFSACDLFLPWSERAARLLRERWTLPEDAAPVTGCTRFDFYSPVFASTITSRDDFCRQYGLDQTRPIVTWATQYGYAHLVESAAAREKLRREAADVGLNECNARIGLDFDDLPRIHAQGREEAARAFFSAAKALPKLQFVLRPHPIEDRNFYRVKMRDLNLDNVVFCPSDYIWNVLNASDVHLHRQCTTAVEAWMWDKPSIEMGMDDFPQRRWSDHEAGSDTIRDTESLIQTIQSYLDGRKVDDKVKCYRREYISANYGPMDGQRCAAAAQSISAFLERRGRRRRYRDSMGEVAVAPRDALTAGLRYLLAKKPNESLIRVSQPSTGPEDKLITREDVARYGKLVAPAVVRAAQ
jgi:surface carbohydrate biosynthesis protein